MAEQPQLVARGLFESIHHPVLGAHPTPGLPCRFASVERWLHRPAPTLGQHNVEALGLDPVEHDRLLEVGVIGMLPEWALTTPHSLHKETAPCPRCRRRGPAPPRRSAGGGEQGPPRRRGGLPRRAVGRRAGRRAVPRGQRRPGRLARQLVVDQVLRANGVDFEALWINTIGIGMGLPTVLTYGTEEHHDKHLKRIFTGEDIWCQMFSEPSHGSDVAGLASRAVRDGDEWVVNGQKVWTSVAHRSSLRHAARAHRPRRAQAQGPVATSSST